MKNYDIDKILKPAFKLFLTHNYESVSTPKLEKEAGLTRGAIFYKHKSKKALFIAVVDRYILNSLTRDVKVPSNIMLKEYIDSFLNDFMVRMESMKELGIENVHRGIINLIYEALKNYPNFEQKISQFVEDYLEQWTIVIQHALDSGEIVSKCEAKDIARQFKYLYSAMILEQSFDRKIGNDLLYDYYNTLKR